MSRYMHINRVRRKPGSLVPLEAAICRAAAELFHRDVRQFHGYQIAREIAEASDARLLTAYGTLYRALGRLEQMGLLVREWEDPQIAAGENRPRRRLYTLTDAGRAALAAADPAPAPSARARRLARA